MRSHKQLAIDAVQLVTPSIEQLFNHTNRKELHIIIMDPQVKPWESSFEGAILHEASLGNPEQWTIPFDQLARKKAQQAWREGAANLNNQSVHPTSLREGDILFYGSFVYGNVVVACSGVEQWFDMLVSGWLAVAMEQLAIHDYQAQKLQNPTQAYRD